MQTPRDALQRYDTKRRVTLMRATFSPQADRFQPHDIVILFLTIGLLYNTKFRFLPDLIIISSGGFFLTFAALLTVGRLHFPQYLSRITIVYLFFTVTASISAFAAHQPEPFVFQTITYYFFTLVVIAPVYITLYRSRSNVLIQIFVIAGVIQGSLIILMFLSPVIRDYYLNLLRSTDITQIYGAEAGNSPLTLRMLGLTGTATYGSAVLQIILAFFWVAAIPPGSKRITTTTLIKGVVLLGSAILSGRVAFVGFLFLFPYMISRLGLASSLRIIVFLSLLASLIALFTLHFLPNDIVQFIISWILAPFEHGLATGSVSVNLHMLNLNWDNFHWLGAFRFHQYASAEYYMDNDVGWYRLILAFGFIGSLGFIIFLFFSILVLFPKRKAECGSLLVLLFTFVAMFKGLIFVDLNMLILLIVVIYLATSNTNPTYKSLHR